MPVAFLIPRKQITSQAEGSRQEQKGQAEPPGELTRSTIGTRPHDLELVSVYDGTMKGRITSIVSLGFEAQVTVELDDRSTTWVQLSRNELSQMGLRVALLVGVRRRADVDN